MASLLPDYFKKKSVKMNSLTIAKFAIYLAFIWFSPCYCFEFDQNYFGVELTPYVKLYSDQAGKSYTYSDMKTQLTLVSEKFPNILIRDDFVYEDYYLPNFTYYHGSYASAYAGEMAAIMNKEYGSRRITIGYQVLELGTLQKGKWDISVALEAAEKANAIFSETVTRISLYMHDDLQRTLSHLHTYRSNASALGIQLGAAVNCYQLRRRANETWDRAVRQIVEAADFIICGLEIQSPTRGAEKQWPSIDTDLMSFKHMIGGINSGVEVIARTMWSSSGLTKFQTAQDLKLYWELASKFAGEKQYRVYLSEAFDNPNRGPDRSKHWGWWKLRPDSKTDSVDGYVEKISEPTTPSTTTTTPPPTMPSTPKNEDNTTTGQEEKTGKDDSSKPDETSYVLLATVAVISGILLLSVAVIIFFFYRRSKQPTVEVMSAQDIRDFIHGTINESNASSLKGSATAAENAIKFPYDNSLEITKENLKIDNKHELGSGEFGYVYKAIIEMNGANAVEVALKVAKENSQLTALKGLLSEIKIMSYLGKHPNIVTLKGAYTAELNKGCVYVATELCNLGSLESFLRENQSNEREKNITKRKSNVKKAEQVHLMEMRSNTDITFQDMVRWSLEIARGMEYIEQRQVIHADLATRNVLLSADKTAKISDFGLSRRMYNYMNYVKKNQEPLPWRWMAIESLKRMEFSSKSDVWSYGVTLWEIFSKGDAPYPGLSWTQGFVNRLESGLRPNCPKFASPEIYNMMRDCWDFQPSDRPTFTQLVECMESLSPKSHVGDTAPGKNVYLNIN